MRFLPTSPLLLARPSGNRPDAELSNSLGVPTPLHATTTALPFWRWIAPFSL